MNKQIFQRALVGLICAVTIGAEGDAAIVSADVVKKCVALTAKAFPPRVVGNPAAGAANGMGSEKRDFYKKCLADESKTEPPEK